ncbi:DEAD/DEAH box helicase family protein [Volucribacter amazonae]|uniref:Type III restriction endonuclease subunit R n=1 Tax=Volucribacter amazonae TaxID=256731 RepID=A0A9X4P9L4_9PAST|nr:DEAD/DEAH box helicase family protein [Volucribacter amazonae]MDG6895160.1 type III restriction endonuclease subunit R [Volucribacter amazonae]
MAKKAKQKGEKSQAKSSFHQHLLLNRWLLSLFNQTQLSAFKERLNDERLLGLGNDGQTHFFAQLNSAFFRNDRLSEQDLRRYDLNIIAHWQKITSKRNEAEGHILEMKYFQYLSLLFTEIYLDWYVHRQEALLSQLNRVLEEYNKDQTRKLSPYQAQDLNKIAFWSATGSGKTLLMHINLLQYQHYVQDKIDNIIILTPSEDLSRQHLQELEQSDFSATLFDKNAGRLFQETIFVMDINKLADKTGEKTVAVEAFAGNNLVLIDEGHRGMSGSEWLARREKLIDKGFAFEYSATFGQAVVGAKTALEQEEEYRKAKAKLLFGKRSLNGLNETQLTQIALSDLEKQQARQTAMFEVYAKAVLFDYSYKFFYEDGYGKESLILNLKDEDYAMHSDVYLTACLLAFYQQLYLFDKHRQALREWNIEKPLCVFVGNKVADEDSDVLKVLNFLALFCNEPARIQSWLHDLLADTARLTDRAGNNIFFGRFTPLMEFLGKESDLYADMLQRLFHATARGRLRLTLLKKNTGELALSVGNASAFGVINIGDATSFYKTAAQQTAFDCDSDDFSDSLFHHINQTDSPTHLLIGSRKFAAGWSSWRVSTMGLLNMGKKEGSQIIQLFGRGVRLKGKDFSLKRSLPANRPKNIHLEKLETLNIFGIAAGYMEQFKQYLREEGITPSDELLEIQFKVRPNLQTARLKTLRLQDGYKDNQAKGFKRQVRVKLYEIPENWHNNTDNIQRQLANLQAELDCYPKIELYHSHKEQRTVMDKRQVNRFNKRVFECFDWDKIYLALLDFKLKKSWFNLQLDKACLRQFAEQNHWYKLYAPDEELTINTFADINKQQSWLIELLCRYTERFYQRLKALYEGQYYQIVEVDENHPSLQNTYLFKFKQANEDGEEYHQRLMELKNIVENGTLQQALSWNNGSKNITAICFKPHLYYPLINLDNLENLPFTMQPLDMNEASEIRFVKDLQSAFENGELAKWIGDKDLYLLRNAANRSKGLGFALAGNFYPDFLLWIVDKDNQKQWLNFIDPKGIRQMSLNDPKFALAEEVKRLEKELALDIQLNAFILSVTDSKDLINAQTITEEMLKEKNILFMKEDCGYLEEMFGRILLG